PPVELSAPVYVPAARFGRMWHGGKPSARSSQANGIIQGGSRQVRWRWQEAGRVGWVVSVEPEQGMEMDGSPALEFGDLGVGELDVRGLGKLVEAAPQADHGAAPQLGCVSVP